MTEEEPRGRKTDPDPCRSPRALSPVEAESSIDPSKVMEEVRDFLKNDVRDVTFEEILLRVNAINAIVEGEPRTFKEKREAERLKGLLEEYCEKFYEMSESALGDSLCHSIVSCDIHPIDLDRGSEQAVDRIDIHMLIDRSEISFGKILGGGVFGDVRKATWHGLPVAVKELKPSKKDDKNEIHYMETEIMIMARLRHPTICEYLGYVRDPLGIVLRYYPFTLEDFIRDNSLRLEDRFRISSQIVAGIWHMHSMNLLHRDLKPANILIDENGNAKIADFGLTMMVPRGKLYDKYGPSGSEVYMAPEMLLHAVFDSSCEVFSLGVILFALFTGRFHFANMTVEELKVFYRKQSKPVLVYSDKDYSKNKDYDTDKPIPELFTLLTECCSYDVSERPSLSKLLKLIVEYGALSTIRRSNSTKEFWVKISNGMYCDHIPFKAFLREIDFPSKAIPPKTISDTITAAVPKSWKPMDIKHFWYLSCWFPFFFNSELSFRTMNAIVFSDWFVRSEEAASSRLKGMIEKSFVIRPSATNPFFCPFTICYVNKGKPEKAHIHRKVKEGRVWFSCSLIRKEPEKPDESAKPKTDEPEKPDESAKPKTDEPEKADDPDSYRPYPTLLELVDALMKECGFLIPVRKEGDY